MKATWMVLGMMAMTATAQADAISTPRDCAPGSRGDHWGHGPGYCAPAPCTSDADCAPRWAGDVAGHCQETCLCVVAEDVVAGMGHAPPGTPPPTPARRQRVE